MHAAAGSNTVHTIEMAPTHYIYIQQDYVFNDTQHKVHIPQDVVKGTYTLDVVKRTHILCNVYYVMWNA